MNEYIKEAINEAKKSISESGIPIGAVLVKENTIIAKGHNRLLQDNNPISHAEMDCLKNAGRVGSYSNMTIYSTLLPCYMCSGAIIQFGIKKVVAGESKNGEDTKALLKSHGVEVIDLDLKECKEMMKGFIDKHPDLWDEDCGKL